jgi:hypothetical protein
MIPRLSAGPGSADEEMHRRRDITAASLNGRSDTARDWFIF